MDSIVMGPCAAHLPGAKGRVSMTLEGKVADLNSATGTKVDL